MEPFSNCTSAKLCLAVAMETPSSIGVSIVAPAHFVEPGRRAMTVPETKLRLTTRA